MAVSPTSHSPGAYTASGGSSTIADTTTSSVASGRKVFAVVGWFGASTLSSVSGGSLTWTTHVTCGGTGLRVAIASADAPAGLASSTTITATISGTDPARNIRIYSCDLLELNASSGLDSTASTASSGTTNWSQAITTVAANTAIFGAVWIDFYASGVAPAAGSTELYDWVLGAGDSESQLVYKEVTSAGADSVGGTDSGFQRATAAVAFTYAAVGGGGASQDAWTPMRPGFMVGAAFPQFMWAFSAPFSSDGSVTIAADGTASLTLSASGVSAASSAGTGSLTLSASGAATAPATGTASLTLGGSGTAQGVAAGTGSLTLSGTGAATAPAAGTGSITFSATGTAAAQGAASGTGSLTLSASGSASAPVAGSGSITFSATGTATGGGQATGTGSLTLSATGAATSPSSGTGAIALTGSATAASRAAASGSLTLTATGTATLGNGGTGTLTLVGAGTGRAVIVSTASLTLSAAGAIAATAGGTAQLVLSATGTGSGPITADPYPINITIREERHTATLREATHTATLTAEPTQATLKASA